MKVKSLLLSMCAIAALASCSQNDDEITSVNDAPEAKVTIKFAGSGAATRAGEIGTGDAVINKLTAFFFNSSGALIKSPVNANLATDVKNTNEVTLATTTDATQVVLVANAPQGVDYTGVTNISKLKEVVISSLGVTIGENTPITQTSTNLTMSGWGGITMGENKGTATVQLHFISARISKITFKFTDVDSQAHYGANEAALDDPEQAWFTIKQAYLMTAQTKSTLIPDNATVSAWDGRFGPTTGFEYTGGVKWGTGQWQPAKGNHKVSADYLNSTISAPSSGTIDNVVGANPWYVFENNSTDQTAVVVEALCNIYNHDTKKTEKKSRYFTVYFGEKKAGASAGNFDIIKAGNDYSITLTAKSTFDPKTGTGGGSTPDPTKPSVEADVTITVNTATWTANATIDKEFG